MDTASPRSALNAAEAVGNQSTPLRDANLFALNRPLRDALAHHWPGFDRARFDAMGVEMGAQQMQLHARLANLHPPELHTHDAQGRRIDQVEFHPSYHALMASALRHRLHGAPWAAGPGGHIERAAGFMLFTELEPSVLCPVSMSYAVTPALRANAALFADWGAGLADPVYDPRFTVFSDKRALTMGMGMTEKQGGSDVRANTTRAERDGSDAWGERYRINGHKWFFSAPMCDAHLVLAQSDSGPSCFFVPRILPGGVVNGLRLQRLKDKLGNHANASSEVEFHDATGWLIGQEGRGIPQILAMGALTRLDCALGTAGLMRAALLLAIHHAAQRHAFGRRLIEHALMKAVLADLALESEAATALALRLAAAVDRSEHGQDPDGREALMRRLLTPVAKFWICKRGSGFAQEAMECFGGNGYVEARGEGVIARVYREMPLNSIWEGAGNIMALDLLRALRADGIREAIADETAAAARDDARIAGFAGGVLRRIDDAASEGQGRVLARDVALLLQAALLHAHAPPAVFSAFCASRIAQACDVYGALPAGLDLDAIVDRAMEMP